MNTTIKIFCLVTALLLAGCAKDDGGTTPAPKAVDTKVDPVEAIKAVTPSATAKLESRSASSVTGMVEIFENSDGTVTFRAEIFGATPGPHAIHIHEVGDCSGEDGMTTGGHWNPTEQPHGPEHGPHHAGDLGNIEVDAEGHGVHKVVTRDFNTRPGDALSCLGKSVIVHEQVDDFQTQPSGNAGARIACGVISSVK